MMVNNAININKAKKVINGSAVSIECFLDHNYRTEYAPCIRWASYNKNLKLYQGAMIKKDHYTKKFPRKPPAKIKKISNSCKWIVLFHINKAKKVSDIWINQDLIKKLIYLKYLKI
jgi:hypothetical protein